MSIEVGSKLQGKVTGITNFGAFIELPDGKTGLVHISEVADNYVKDINEHLTVGDEVTVKVLNVETMVKLVYPSKKQRITHLTVEEIKAIKKITAREANHLNKK